MGFGISRYLLKSYNLLNISFCIQEVEIIINFLVNVKELFSLSLSSVTQSCLTLCDSHGLQHATPPCLSPIPEFTQTHDHWVGDAIQPSHPLSSTSPLAFNLSQHQDLFQWVSSSHQVAKVSASASVLPMNIQDWFPLGWTGWICLHLEIQPKVSKNICVCTQLWFW